MRRDYKRDFKEPRGSSHGLLFSDDYKKVVIVEDLESNGSTRYSLPGGRKKYGEGWMSTLEKEVKEETGFSILGSIRNIIWLKRATRYFPNKGEQRFYIIPMYTGDVRKRNYKKETGAPFFVSIVDAIRNENYLHLVHRIALMRAVEYLMLFKKDMEIAFELYDVFERLEYIIELLKKERGVYVGSM